MLNPCRRMCSLVKAHTHTHTLTHSNADTYAHTHTHTHTRTHTYTHTYTHAHTHKNTYTHTHTSQAGYRNHQPHSRKSSGVLRSHQIICHLFTHVCLHKITCPQLFCENINIISHMFWCFCRPRLGLLEPSIRTHIYMTLLCRNCRDPGRRREQTRYGRQRTQAAERSETSISPTGERTADNRQQRELRWWQKIKSIVAKNVKVVPNVHV
jgi:hypothetical protein